MLQNATEYIIEIKILNGFVLSCIIKTLKKIIYKTFNKFDMHDTKFF